MKQDIITAIQACIQIKSVKDVEHAAPGAPFGPGIQEGLEWILALGEKFGFTVKNVEGYAGHIEMGSGDLLGILGHIDVVPEGEGWSVPPFSATIKDGKIFGRGALDDKGPSLAALFAMKAIIDAQIPLNKRVRLIIGTDEESGWADMDYYFSKEEVPQIGFAPDAEFPVIHAEKGILHLELSKSYSTAFPHLVRIHGGERANVVPDYCEVTLKGIVRDDINT
jgi:succinyl-diaminopimelate desuccinylase